MNDIIIQPHAFLVFTPASNLNQLTTERDKVQEVFEKCGSMPHVRFGLDLNFLRIVQQHQAQTLVIFHYGGHATPDGIEHEVEKDGAKERQTLLYSELADYLETSFIHLKLIFINGCDSEQAVNFFLRKADALICTNRPIGDTEAYEFAKYFYDNFLNTNYLALAFESTQKYLAFGKSRGVADFQIQRGAMSTAVLNQETPSVFELKLRDNNPELGKSTFQSWKQIIQPNLTQAKETTITTKNMGIPEHAYLRCNREDQVFFFEQGLGKKMDKQTPQPLFVFIHGLEDHCPLDLFDRFVNYTLVEEKWGLNKTPTEIELPINPKLNDLDLCKLTLLESYCHQGKFGQQNADRTWSLTQQMPDNQWIVIQHKLSYGKWQPNWGDFFDYYVNEFGRELAEKMSQKLIIVTTRSTRNEADEFAQYFEQLANDPTKQVVNLTGFEKINQDHISAWQEEVFGTTKFKSSDIVAGNDEKFFFEIKELLKARLL
jgi:hypothetical protein